MPTNPHPELHSADFTAEILETCQRLKGDKFLDDLSASVLLKLIWKLEETYVALPDFVDYRI